MRRIFLICAFLLALVICAQQPADRCVPVILTAGQSNADGRVPLAELPTEFQTYKYCLWSYGSGDFETATGQFVPFSPRVAKPGIERSWGFDAVWLFPVGAVCGDCGVMELIATTAHSDTLAGIPWRQGRQQDIS